MDPTMQHGDGNVAIFWDYENCEVPNNVDGFSITSGIQRIAHQYGSVKVFKAYWASPEIMTPKPAAVRWELQACGVSVIDCQHNGRKDTADKMMMVDMLAFAGDTPTPATVVLITGDGDFLYAISTLRLRKYRIILLAPSNCTSPGLKVRATAVYDWPRDVLSAELPEPNPPVLAGSVLMTSATIANSKNSSAPGARFGTIPMSLDPTRPSTSYATVNGTNKALSQPNTPQSAGQYRLTTAPARPRAGSVQNHSRTTSMPIVPQSATNTNYGLATPQTQSGSVQSDSSRSQSRTEHIQDNDRHLASPWRLKSMLPTTPSTQAGPLSPLVTALDGDAPHDLPSHEEGAEEQDGDGQYPTESFQLSGPSADMISEEDAALSSVPLTSDPMLLHVGFESTGIALTPLQLGEGSPKQGRSDTVSSDETVKAQDPATDVPPGFRLAFVGENIVVPTVEMTRLRRPPRIYEALVTILESERLKGNTRMPSSQVGANLREIDKHIYTKAGCTKLKEYIQKAVKDGVVLSGSLSGGLLDNGNIWVALHPVYHGNAPEPVQVALPLV